MAQPVIQSSFNSGEWAPALYSRVDLQKYHSGAALLRNFFVDYRGGATARAGTSYILEFGEVNGVGYLVFYNNGSPVLTAPLTITGVTQAFPASVSVTNTYAIGDVVFISGVVGMTQLNGNYYKVINRNAGSITLGDLNGNAIDSSPYGAYVSGGTVQSIYGIGSPYTSAELSALKFAQNVNTLTICHPNHPPYVLTLTSATNWAFGPINFGPTIAAPTGLGFTTTLAAASTDVSYIVTAVDANGQESARSAVLAVNGFQDIR